MDGGRDTGRGIVCPVPGSPTAGASAAGAHVMLDRPQSKLYKCSMDEHSDERYSGSRLTPIQNFDETR
jgi:hypothetical protein